jgi:hypothetical protein
MADAARAEPEGQLNENGQFANGGKRSICQLAMFTENLLANWIIESLAN